jgi:hypothetical protein
VVPLLATAAAAVVIAAAPVASAAQGQIASSPTGMGAGATSSSATQTQQTCLTLGATQNQCQTPGNAQIYDAPPQVDYFPYAGGAT